MPWLILMKNMESRRPTLEWTLKIYQDYLLGSIQIIAFRFGTTKFMNVKSTMGTVWDHSFEIAMVLWWLLQQWILTLDMDDSDLNLINYLIFKMKVFDA